MAASIIQDFYDRLLGFYLDYESAKQYFDCLSSHIEFVYWFIEDYKKIPKSYLNNWHLFKSWLVNPKIIYSN